MIYQTGSANSFADLLSTVKSVCTSNGYTWDSSSNALVGNNIAASLTVDVPGTYLSLTVGTAVDGNGGLLNSSPSPSFMLAGGTIIGVSFPVSYRIFLYNDPDLVWISINHNGSYWQHMGFGFVTNFGCTGDSGRVPFQHANFSAYAQKYGNSSNPIYSMMGVSFWSYGPQRCSSGIFSYAQGGAQYGFDYANSFAYINEPDGYGYFSGPTKWVSTLSPRSSDPLGYSGSQATWHNAALSTDQANSSQPNEWNGDAALVPIQVGTWRPSGFYSIAFEIPHMRLVRNDYYDDGEVVTRGTDQWMTMPWRRKDTSNRFNFEAYDIDASGTHGLAMEYDGS